MQISPAGIALIKQSEGFSAHVYNDIGGLPTVGYGHKLLEGESFAEGVTEAQAETLLQGDLALPQLVLSQLVPADCTQGQWDALCDFTFNMGVTRLRTLLAHGWQQVPFQLPRWTWGMVNGIETQLPGLIARREAELKLFIS